MAYSNSPEKSTYKSVPLEFVYTSWPRSGSTSIRRDAEIVNMFYDRNGNENQTRSMTLTKRPGVTDNAISLAKTSASSVINGFFQDESTNYMYWSVDGKVFELNISGGAATQIASMTGTITDTINSVGFTSFLTDVGTRYVCFCNGTELYYSVPGSGTSTKIVDADFPSNPGKDIVFLDGYLFVFKRGTGDIYNSDLNAPGTWTSGNYITTEINPDFVVSLAKIKNYIIAFGNEGIEFFYDAANLSGSPLARNESYYKNVTLCSNVVTVGDSVYFVGRKKNQGLQVFELDANEIKPVSNNMLERILQTYGNSSLTSSLSTTNLFASSVNGHNFIFVNFYNEGITFVYDMDHKFWYRWSFGDAGITTNRIQAMWTINSTTGLPRIAVGGRSNMSYFDNSFYQDFGANFTASYTTEDYDADTFNWKMCHRMGLHCDFPTTAVATSNAQVSWSDDDGNTFTTPRNLNVCSSNPYITQCGRFRSRNWRIEYSDNYPFRMWGMTMDLNVGSV